MKNPVRHLCSLLGFLAVAIYIAMAIAAWTFYPAPFGPVGSWLSDLGNNDLNPDGALYYRLGGILGGLALVGFFLALDGRAWGERRAVRVFAALVRAFGILAAACFIMTGVFSEDMMPMHSWFSIANYAAFGTAIALTGIAKLSGAALPKSLAVLCFAAWGFDIASAIFRQVRWLEWVVVAFLIAYAVFYSIAGLRSVRGDLRGDGERAEGFAIDGSFPLRRGCTLPARGRSSNRD
jgi:hypothetical membrane protein